MSVFNKELLTLPLSTIFSKKTS